MLLELRIMADPDASVFHVHVCPYVALSIELVAVAAVNLLSGVVSVAWSTHVLADPLPAD